MKDVKKIYILFKKDVLFLKNYIISFFLLYLFFVVFFTAIYYFSNEKNIIYYEFALFLSAFVLSLSWSLYMPIRSITHEEKARTFKILKGLPLTNYHIFFSKLLLGYISSLILFSIPGIIILIHRYLLSHTISENTPNEIANIITLRGFIELIFILILASTISTCLYINFKGSQIFIGVEVIFIIFMIGFFIIINMVGKDDITLSKIFLIPFSQVVKVLFLFSPLLVILCVFLGYKFFDKHRSYIKFQ